MIYIVCIFFIQSIYQHYLKFRIGWARHLAYFCPWAASAKFHPAYSSILYELHYGCRFRYDTGAFVCLLHLRVSDFPCTTFMLSHIEGHSVAVFAYAGNDQDLKEYPSIWCQELGSNQPHPILQTGALPTELSWHLTWY